MTLSNESAALPVGATATINRLTCITCSLDHTDAEIFLLSRYVHTIIEACGMTGSEAERLQKAFSDHRLPMTVVLSTNALELTLNFLPKWTG
jgi:hypothetical protein